MSKIISIAFILLTIVTVIEVGYYTYLVSTKNKAQNTQQTSNFTKIEPTLTITSINLTSSFQGSNLRSKPSNYYAIDKSFVDYFIIHSKDNARNYYVSEQNGIIKNLDFNNKKYPDLFCFLLKNDINQNYCLGKSTKIYYYSETGEQKIVSYTILKSDDHVIYIEKHDMSKPFGSVDNLPEISIQIDKKI